MLRFEVQEKQQSFMKRLTGETSPSSPLPYLWRWTVAAEARCPGCSTGSFCPPSHPGSAAYGRAPSGWRRSGSQEGRWGAGGRQEKIHVNTNKMWCLKAPRWQLENIFKGSPIGQNTSTNTGICWTCKLSLNLRAKWSWNGWFCSQVVFKQQHTANCRKAEPHISDLQALQPLFFCFVFVL